VSEVEQRIRLTKSWAYSRGEEKKKRRHFAMARPHNPFEREMYAGKIRKRGREVAENEGGDEAEKRKRKLMKGMSREDKSKLVGAEIRNRGGLGKELLFGGKVRERVGGPVT